MPEELLVVENLDEFIEILRRRAPEAFQRASKTAMTKNVIDVTGWAKQNSPVDSSRLKTSIGWQVDATFGDVTGFVGTNVKTYPAIMEQPGNVRGVGRRPWLSPAVTEHVNQILKTFEDIFRIVARRLGF